MEEGNEAGGTGARVIAGWPAVLEGGPLAVEARVMDRLRRYVERETPTGDAVRTAAFAAELAGELTGAGFDVEAVDAPGWGRHLRARMHGGEPGLAPLLLLAHLDTVHPAGTLAAMPFAVTGGRATGPGIFDMKAGLAILVEAAGALTAAGLRPRRAVHVLVTCDEESGSPSSRGLIEEAARDAGAVLVLEPALAGGAAKTARKGVGEYTLRITGLAAHAGIEPERGVSAVTELAHQVLRVLALADPGAGTTLNVGVVAGGTAPNVVAAEAHALVDARFFTLVEGERVDAALRALAPVLDGAAIHIDGGINRPPLERTEGVLQLYRHARGLAAELGFELGEGGTGGGSDGCFTAALNIPTLDGLGVEGGGAHAADEHILVADVARRVALLVRLLETA